MAFAFYLYIDDALVVSTTANSASCNAGSITYNSPGYHGTYEFNVSTNSIYRYDHMTGYAKNSSGNWYSWSDTDNYHYSSYGLGGPVYVYWYTKKSYTLTMGNDGNGTTSPSAGSHTYTAGTTVNLSANGNTGYEFDHWEYSIGQEEYISKDNPASTTLNSNQGWKAFFKAQWKLTLTNDGHGTTSPSEGTYYYSKGSSVTLSATPSSGYEFSHWEYSIGEETYTSTSNPVTFTINANQGWKACFQLPETTYTLSYDANGGSGGPNTQTTIARASSYHFVIPDDNPTRSGRNFLGWSFDSSAKTASYSAGDTVTLYNTGPSKTLYAVWSDEIGPLTLKVETSGAGNAFIQTVGTTEKIVPTGQSAYIIARETTDNWAFKCWEFNESIISELTQLLIHNTSPYKRTETYKAVFTHGVRVKVNYDENKCSVRGQGNYEEYESCTLTITEKVGWKFKLLYNTGTGFTTPQNPYTYTITDLNPKNNIWSVGMVRTYHLHVTVNDETLGSATGEGWYEEGTTVTVIATAKSGGKFLYFSVNGSVYESPNHTYIAYVGTKQINVIAVFQESEVEFEPRESAEGLDKSNIYYRAQNVEEDGVYGYNPYTGNTNPTNGGIIGNCTWFAQGRSAEIAGKDIRDQLPNMHNANMWFGETDLCPWAREGYVDPSGHDGEALNIALGDIVCYTGLTFGHVEIIEEITDTTVTISNSSYAPDSPDYYFLFRTHTYNRSEFTINGRGWMSSSHKRQGVIHNPFIGTPGSKKPTEATITVEDTPGGEVYIDGEKGGGTSSVAVGQVITLYAQPKKGYKFVSWSDGIISNPRKYTVTGTITIYPIYEKLTDFGTVMFLTPNGDNAMIR